MRRIDSFRKKYPKFIYEGYTYRISKKPLTRASTVWSENLEILFNFNIKPNLAPEQARYGAGIKFRPKIIIENVKESQLKKVGESTLKNLIFHLGLIEIPSYWKTTCSPEIEIRAGYLNQEQIKLWKDLIINGMGQFFYENKIDWRKKDFLKITSNSEKNYKRFDGKLKNRYLVPFAGGRDSIVTLESLKKLKKEIALFTVNPIEKIQKVVKVSGIRKQIIVRRIIDKKLLELNKKGFLNGHTPFTAVLSFLSVCCATLFDYKNIAFSNEKSADEGNVRYLGKMINHQWAKSSEFEKMFKKYCHRYLAKNINYFSYLRKYTELEISKMLTKYPQYFSVFSSCNAGMRINASGLLRAKKRWCGNCIKCLFVYASLYPYLEKKQLLKIFGRDFFENPEGKQASYGASKRLLIMQQLIGKKGHKPFECIGTKKESRMAFELSLKKAKKEGKLPYLLTKFK